MRQSKTKQNEVTGGTANAFRVFAAKTSTLMGQAWSFAIALIIILIWAVTGPIFHYSDTWQLIINTGTTIVTFLMVFLIQNAQNRDTKSIHLKLDEIICAIEGARNHLVDIEKSSDEELNQLKEEFHQVRKEAKNH